MRLNSFCSLLYNKQANVCCVIQTPPQITSRPLPNLIVWGGISYLFFWPQGCLGRRPKPNQCPHIKGRISLILNQGRGKKHFLFFALDFCLFLVQDKAAAVSYKGWQSNFPEGPSRRKYIYKRARLGTLVSRTGNQEEWYHCLGSKSITLSAHIIHVRRTLTVPTCDTQE